MAVSFIGGGNRRLERAHITTYRLINSNVLQLLTDLPPGGFILGFLKPTEILLNVAYTYFK
jgi:hypothetical protein